MIDRASKKLGYLFIPLIALVFTLSIGQKTSAQTITINNDLIFGAVFPGTPKTITKTTAGAAAEFLISGSTNAEVTIDFALPTYMSTGSYTMQMIFLETDLAIDTKPNPDQAAPEIDNLNPWRVTTDRLGAQGITCWLGGTVVPRLGQPQGSYSAIVVLTVTLTGN